MPIETGQSSLELELDGYQGDQGWAGLGAQLHGLVSKLVITDR